MTVGLLSGKPEGIKGGEHSPWRLFSGIDGARRTRGTSSSENFDQLARILDL